MASPFDPSLSRPQRMLLEITEAGKRVQAQATQPATKAPSAAPVAAVGYDLEKVASLVGHIIEARKQARNDLKSLL